MKKLIYPIVTERLKIAPYRPEFGEDLFQLEQLPQTHRYNYSPLPSRRDVQTRMERLLRYDYLKPRGRMEWAILLGETDRYIGFIGLKGDDYPRDGTAEIYYTIHPDFFGRGYGTEAVRGTLDFAFSRLELHRVWAGATCENVGSWRIMEKVGMRRETRWIKDRPKPGEWIPGRGFEKTDRWEDGYGYAILREEFQNLGTVT